MKTFISLFFLIFLLFGCSKSKKNLVVVENDHNIDLTNIDSVRENLNGFWIPENQVDEEDIVRLDFHKDKNFSTWKSIPYNEKIKKTEIFPIESCQTNVELIKINRQIQLLEVNLGGSDTSKIEHLLLLLRG